jgi:hypothetical protein
LQELHGRRDEKLPPMLSQSPRLSSFMMEKLTFQQGRAPPGRDAGGSLECDTLLIFLIGFKV